MLKIGEFSNLSKTTIKTLRYYEKEGLLIPIFIDEQTGYRFYESSQLINLSKIIELRQLGISIKDIKKYLIDNDLEKLLNKRKEELEKQESLCIEQLSQINHMIGGKNMKYEAIKKVLPDCTVYYKEGIIKSFGDLTEFILSSEKECRSTNPDIKCIQPDYCYVNYLDCEYKDKDIKVRYCQAVTKEGVPNETIKFEKLKPVTAICIYHKGSYTKLREAYGFMMNYIAENGYIIDGCPRERYIDGMWNKDDENEWLTEIQVPIKNN